MKQFFYSVVLVFFIGMFSCNKKNGEQSKDTILTGNVTILVDETILPVIQDQVMVFESQYKAKVKLVGKSETEIVKLLAEGKTDLAILTRSLTDREASFFNKKKKIKGVITPLATDAIAFISNNSTPGVKVDINDVNDLMRGNTSKIQGLVFDNANSSTVKYFKDLAKIKDLPKQKIFSFNNNNEVIKFVSENKGMIGVVGVNWLMEPMPEFQNTIEKISVLEVRTKNGTFALPTQDHMASGIYPFTRQIVMLNYQGYSGLGTGFASFVAGQIGQRIILKSGLVPVRIPTRNIIVRKEIEKKP